MPRCPQGRAQSDIGLNIATGANSQDADAHWDVNCFLGSAKLKGRRNIRCRLLEARAAIVYAHSRIAFQSRRSRLLVTWRFGGSTPPNTAIAAAVSQPCLARARFIWSRERCQPSFVSGPWPHAENSDRNSSELVAVPLQEPMCIAMPPPRVDRRTEHHEIPPSDGLRYISGAAKVDVAAGVTQAPRNGGCHLLGRAVLGGGRDKNLAQGILLLSQDNVVSSQPRRRAKRHKRSRDSRFRHLHDRCRFDP